MNRRVVNRISRKTLHGIRVIKRLTNLRYYFLLRDSELFDAQWYSMFPKGFFGKRLPVLHYLVSGAPRGKDPSPHFCGEKYLKQNPMVRESGENPLAHFLLYGKAQDLKQYSRLSVPLKDLLGLLASAPKDFSPLPEAVDVIIPVFNAMHHLRALFDSLFAHTTSPHRFLIVDDASTDPAVCPYLRERIAGRDDCLLLQNAQNLGFPASVNRAANECRGHFVVINTDVVVPRFWLERLMAPIFENSQISCTTPFSNSATIFSFPLPDVDNALLSSDIESLDACFRRLRPAMDSASEAPTGVGFCMGVNGKLWRKIGGFDQRSFGRGYAEENDWCQRALQNGYRSVLAHNLFVSHHHGGSFDGATKKRLLSTNTELLKKRWPNYLPSVHDHMQNDPWSGKRHAAFLALCLSPPARALLVVDAAVGGGANMYGDWLEARALSQSRAVITLRYDASVRRIEASGAYQNYRIHFSLSDEKEILDIVPLGRAETILVNELVSWESLESIFGIIVELKSAWGADIEFAGHDFFPICPTVNLLDTHGNYCRLPSASLCRKCLPKNNHSLARGSDIDNWRSSWRTFLASVDRVNFFSHSAFELMQSVYPEIGAKSTIRPHEHTVSFPPLAYRVPKQTQMVIGVVGLITASHKGNQIVCDLALLLKKHAPGARMVVVGRLQPDCGQANVTVTGKYRKEELPDLLNRHKIQVVLMPSIWPETFSYVTQELISLSCPIVCFDLGGQAEQVKKYDYGRIASGPTAAAALVAIVALLSEIGLTKRQ